MLKTRHNNVKTVIADKTPTVNLVLFQCSPTKYIVKEWSE